MCFVLAVQHAVHTYCCTGLESRVYDTSDSGCCHVQRQEAAPAQTDLAQLQTAEECKVAGRQVADREVTDGQVACAQVTGAQVTGAQVAGAQVADGKVADGQVAGAQVAEQGETGRSMVRRRHLNQCPLALLCLAVLIGTRPDDRHCCLHAADTMSGPWNHAAMALLKLPAE